MRIGIMLRSLDEKGGVGVYTRYITEELLRIDDRNEYVLFYRSEANLGRFADPPRVTERVVGGRQKPVWDQVSIPWWCRKEGIDVLFHPKFTVPLFAPCPTVMTVHGADWFIPGQARFYGRVDVAYIRAVMPLYFRKAAVVLSVSQTTADDFNRILGLEPGKIVTTYPAPGRHFRRVEDPERLRAVHERYGLPERFILTLTKVGGEERKNVDGILGAFERLHGRVPHALVIGGEGCEGFRDAYGIPDGDWGADIHFPGWIDQEDLPAVYTLADLYLHPARLETFGIPITEAMTCGTPVVTSEAHALREIAGDGAVYVDPESPDEIADAVHRLLTDPELHARMRSAGLERSQRYSWERCGTETLEVLERVGS